MQRSPKKLEAVEQLVLLPTEEPARPVDIERICMLESHADALDHACTLARKAPKAIAEDMKKDRGTWSRILSGEFSLPSAEIQRFNGIVKNNAYLLYLNHLDGIDLRSIRKVQDDKDREIARLRTENETLRREREVIVKFVQETKK